MKNKQVTIIGRVNVGKSTLFNRISEINKAIVSKQAGTTRDRNSVLVNWRGYSFILNDCGGITTDKNLDLNFEINSFAWKTAKNSDIILFLLDRIQGVTPEDKSLHQSIRKLDKPIIYVVNKVDDLSHEKDIVEFYQLGAKNINMISSLHDIGIGELLEDISMYLTSKKVYKNQNENHEVKIDEQKNQKLKILVLGRPNVGKSTLVNRLLKEERMIISGIPGTTRDSITQAGSIYGFDFLVTDSAGIRPKQNIIYQIEKDSVKKAMMNISLSDICILIYDINDNFSHQDSRIAQLVIEKYKSLIIVANKCDKLNFNRKTAREYKKNFYLGRPFLKNYDILFISALNGMMIKQLMKSVNNHTKLRIKKVNIASMNRFIKEINLKAKLPTHLNRILKINYGLQVGTNPPKFLFFVNDPKLVADNFHKFINNKLIETFGWRGTPLRIFWRKKN